MSAAFLPVLQHALGLDQYGRGDAYRSHFCAGPGDDDYLTCVAMTDQGLMTRRDRLPVVSGTMFHVTDKGRNYVRENSPAPPKLTRGQRRYQDYLSADCELSFGEWLKQPRAETEEAR